VAASVVWAFADTLDGEGGASANFAAAFPPPLSPTWGGAWLMVTFIIQSYGSI